MTNTIIETLKNIDLENLGYDYIGLRSDYNDYEIGEIMENSYIWVDGNEWDGRPTEDEAIWQLESYDNEVTEEAIEEYRNENRVDPQLNGTCVIKLVDWSTEATEEIIEKAAELIIRYTGKNIYLVGGNNIATNIDRDTDENEMVIKNCKVIKKII